MQPNCKIMLPYSSCLEYTMSCFLKVLKTFTGYCKKSETFQEFTYLCNKVGLYEGPTRYKCCVDSKVRDCINSNLFKGVLLVVCYYY